MNIGTKLHLAEKQMEDYNRKHRNSASRQRNELLLRAYLDRREKGVGRQLTILDFNIN